MSLEALDHIQDMWKAAEDNFKNKRHPDDFPELPELATGRYTREDFFALEQSHLWKRTWLLAGFIDELPDIGCYKTAYFAEVPVLIVRGEDGQIRAFYNACRHRGAMLVHEPKGKEKKFACKYHCWTYDLTGKLSFVADERQFPGLDKSKKPLISVQCDVFGNMIFINFDENAEPLSDFLGNAAGLMSDVPFENVKLYKTVSMELPYNWKVLQDNFSENHHAAFVHPETINPLINAKVTARQLLDNGHAAFAIKSRNKSGDKTTLWEVSDGGDSATQPKNMLNELSQISQRNYNIFPNLTLPIAETIYPLLAIWPLSVDRSRVDIHFLKIEDPDNPIDSAAYDQAVDFLGTIVKEDFGVLEGIQQSLKSGGVPSLRLCWEEQVIYHYNLMIDRVIGAENIPQALQVKDINVPVAGK